MLWEFPPRALGDEMKKRKLWDCTTCLGQIQVLLGGHSSNFNIEHAPRSQLLAPLHIRESRQATSRHNLVTLPVSPIFRGISGWLKIWFDLELNLNRAISFNCSKIGWLFRPLKSVRLCTCTYITTSCSEIEISLMGSLVCQPQNCFRAEPLIAIIRIFLIDHLEPLYKRNSVL